MAREFPALAAFGDERLERSKFSKEKSGKEMEKEQVAAVRIFTGRPGQRIGIVRIGEAGYYVSYLDRPEWSDDEVNECIRKFNGMLGVPDDVADSAMAGSMFGWNTPAAHKAVVFFEGREYAGGGR